MSDSRIKILTTDRPKMAHDISGVFVKHHINIIWMEVYTHVIYVKFSTPSPETWHQMKKDFLSISGVKRVQEVDFIMLEEKELEVNSVLNSIPQGIVIVDKESKIKYINKYAFKNILRLKKGDEIGKADDEFDQTNTIRKLLSKAQRNKHTQKGEARIRTNTYYVWISPITSDDEIISSYMITFEDMRQIREIYKNKRFDNPITFKDIYGGSNKLREIIKQARIYARSDSPVLILGESGTGKELFARASHNESRRSHKLFVALNCAAIPDQLLESELFGYDEGAFTGGKKKGKTGLLELANGGTVFLDEIGEMPAHLQVKLLRVLQEKTIRKLGGSHEIPVNVRIITATNRDIKNMVETGQFRLDLFYRINVFTLTVPPLRERREDIEVLAGEFIRRYSQEYKKKILSIDPEALEKLKEYQWPGNIRELQNMIERAVAVAETDHIHVDLLQFNEPTFRRQFDEGQPLQATVEKVEKEMIQKALKKHRSIREAARNLGVTHTLLINRMKKYKMTNEL
ncbi:MAG: sigma 54-interacting transcriptional regulator [Bacillota bacterium]|nr:sigma 54-interacting transcriptional regulator [Bacillota bacterium]MDW7676555.1 sigma 54-interacting transcriptional regulator [Bacillota bacterium]